MSTLINKGIAVERTVTKYTSYLWYLVLGIVLLTAIYSLIYPDVKNSSASKSRKKSGIVIAVVIGIMGFVYMNNYAVQKSKTYAGVKGVLDATTFVSRVV